VDETGSVLGSATEEHAAFASPQPGWAEQDPRDWWRAGAIAVRGALENANLSGEAISCVGFSGQMHGAVVLDDFGEVIRPALIWCDQRTQPQSEQLLQQFGLDRLIRLSCNPPLTNFTLTKLLWIREHEPKLWDRVRKIMLPKDYVRYRLTGETATDMADASGTLLLDVAKRAWSQEILMETSINSTFLPKLFESQEICGQISKLGSSETGLKAGTPVVAGAGDQAAGAVGIGITKPGIASATIGTSGVVFAATDRPTLDPKGRLHTFCHAIPNRWHVMGVTQAAGLSLKWFREQFGTDGNKGGGGYDELSKEAAAIEPGSGGVFWAPYLMGERTPHLDPDARAALVGLSASHTRAHIVRAILEGVAFSLKDTFTIFEQIGVPVRQIRLGGGGARSPLWRQIQSDVYAQGVEILAAEEGAAYGAAILAGVGASGWSSVDQACDAVVRVVSRIVPDAESCSTMQKSYRTYRRIYPALHSIQQQTGGTHES
jgi:xylulokinase